MYLFASEQKHLFIKLRNMCVKLPHSSLANSNILLSVALVHHILPATNRTIGTLNETVMEDRLL